MAAASSLVPTLEAITGTPADVSAGHDVVLILGYTPWRDAVRRGAIHSEDRLTLSLIGSDRVRRLLVCDPYRSRATLVVRRILGETDPPFPTSVTRRLHQPLRLRRLDPIGIRAVRRSVAAAEQSIRTAARRFGMERPGVISCHPLMAGFGRFDWAGPVTYYATDDLATHPPFRRWWPVQRAAFERIGGTGRRVVGVTRGAVESIRPSGRAVVVPNGIDPAEWIHPGAAPRWFTELPEPRLLYVGTLDTRLDLEQIRALAESHPEGSVVLVGRAPDPRHCAPLASLRNVTIRPGVARSEIPGLVAGADVGLIPHVRDEQTVAMSPLKLYEYIAAGVAVASVNLPGVAGVCPERTTIARTPDDMPAAVRRALELGPWADDARREFIRANAWERRADLLLDVALAP